MQKKSFMMLIVFGLFVGPISIVSELQFHTKKTSGLQWLGEKKQFQKFLQQRVLLIKSAEVGYLTYYVFFYQGAKWGGFGGMGELLGNFQHNDQALLNYGLGFFSRWTLNIVWEKKCFLFSIDSIFLGGYGDSILC